jgi:hypothetical protein
VSSSIADPNPEDTSPDTNSTDTSNQTSTTTSASLDTGDEVPGDNLTAAQPADVTTEVTAGLDETATYLLSRQDGNWVAREVTPLITDDLDTNGQVVIQLVRTPATLLGPAVHPAARQHVDGVCRLRDLNTYGMSDQFGDPRGSDYPEPVRETATDLLATIWTATWRYGISSTEWYEVANLPLGCLDMAVHLANRPHRHAATSD